MYGLLLSSTLVTQGYHLSGTLPPELGDLSQLRYLIMSYQNFKVHPCTLPSLAEALHESWCTA